MRHRQAAWRPVRRLGFWAAKLMFHLVATAQAQAVWFGRHVRHIDKTLEGHDVTARPVISIGYASPSQTARLADASHRTNSTLYLCLVTQRLERHRVRDRERQEAEVEGTLRKLKVDPDVLRTERQPGCLLGCQAQADATPPVFRLLCA